VQVPFREAVVREDQPTDFYAVVYDSHERFIIELEPAANFREFYSARHYLQLYAISVAPKFKPLKSLADMAQEIVETIRFVTGMDRVLLYKLNEDDSGKVSKRDRLMPRSSFEVHIREIVGRSKEWDNHDLDIAERFNRVFMTYALDTHENTREKLTNLQEQDRYRNEFLATLAHELRNPLAPIRTGLSVLEREPDTGTMQTVIARMVRQVENMTTMIDALMDVSRVTTAR
jgi:light-regulated signal transduction histidine kinase (bacteriophytochrome)